MKRINFILLMMAFLIATSVSAQEKRKTPEERAKAQSEAMKKNLGLNEEQTIALEEINLRFAKEVEAKREMNGNSNEKVEIPQEIRDARNAEIKTVLTPDQYEKFLKIKGERQNNKKSKDK